ncbi:MAG TPA: hypothetical protein GX505_12745 [Clostridiales bacterium]|nr:hypothetical protein [Clostridiales bacterium]
MKIDISKIPFSRYGSFLSITKENNDGLLAIRNIKRIWDEVETFYLSFKASGKEVSYRMEADPSCINVYSDKGSAVIYLKGREEIVIVTRSLEIVLHAAEKQGVFAYRSGDSRYSYLLYLSDSFADLGILQGIGEEDFVQEIRNNRQTQTRSTVNILPVNGCAMIHLRISDLEKPYDMQGIDWKKDITEIEEQWNQFLAKLPPVNDKWREAAELAWYNMWASYVPAGGNFKYDAMLMSKGYMSAVWSWDHCFNAMALAKSDLKAALEQFFLMFELQDPYGKIPDLITGTRISWVYTKPPVHGWCFMKLIQGCDVEPDVLKKAYNHLESWTEWYFEFRDTDSDGIPNYITGYDSGWDNASVFDIGCNIESPDLCAFLFLQMKALEEIARRLNDIETALKWKKRADDFLVKFIDHSWTGSGFAAKISGTHEYEEEPGCLLVLMPLVLGEFLNPDMRDVLIDKLVRKFITKFGAATESPDSPKYMEDGYWRGPIWAPVTYLLADGLSRSGRPELAKKLAESYCNMTAQSKGFNENYNALTGHGLCDRGYTWTASVSVLLMNEFLNYEVKD